MRESSVELDPIDFARVSTNRSSSWENWSPLESSCLCDEIKERSLEAVSCNCKR